MAGIAVKQTGWRGERGLTHIAKKQLREFFRGFAGAAAAILLLDYDGTLAPFRVNRFQAGPWAGVRELLNSIQDQGKTRIEVVSGRPAAEVAPLLGLKTPPRVWGLHGAERLNPRLGPNGRLERETFAAEVGAKLKEVIATLRRDALGGLFEEKPNAAVVHWRGAVPRKAREIEKRARALFEPLARMEGLQLLEFECGLELRAGRDKGGAVKAILDEFNNEFAAAGGAQKIPAAYLGDDLTDEAAFTAIRGRGLGVLVRREWRKTQADVWIRPPEELRDFLRKWLSVL
jgi:trehalose 6-phosphate phosphatase